MARTGFYYLLVLIVVTNSIPHGVQVVVLLLLLLNTWRVYEAQGFLFGKSSSKAYSLPVGSILKGGEEFDYIVVGAGAGGSAVAARLALSGANVLLLEAGGDPNFISKIPAAAMALLGSDMDWQYRTLPNNKSCLASQGRQCRFARGKCLGGSTAINYMLYTRGNKRDFDDLNIAGWSYADLLPYFLKYEGLQDLDLLPASSDPYHNTTGTMKIEYFANSDNPWHDRLSAAYRSLNIPFNPDINAESQIGVTKVVGYVYEGERMTAARGYLSRDDVKRRLTVAKNTMCTGVIVDRNNVAKGVTAVQGQRKLNLYARKEVVLSAGAIGTPQILLLSGIGPAEHLNSMGIPVRADLPVGENMVDHALPLLIALVDRSRGLRSSLRNIGIRLEQFAELVMLGQGPLTSNGLTDLSMFMNTKCYDYERRRLLNRSATGTDEDCELPNMQVIHSYVDRGVLSLGRPLFQHAIGFDDLVIDQLTRANNEHALIIISPVNLRPESMGRVRLASRAPLAPPAILPNYLDDERDLAAMVDFIRIVEDIMRTKPFATRRARLLKLDLPGCPRPEEGLRDYWSCYARHMTFAVYHAAGTCSLGRVVDPLLRVRGIGALRVADLSVMPRVPSSPTESATLAIGERCADFLLNGRDAPGG